MYAKNNCENMSEEEKRVLDRLIALAYDNYELVEEAFHRCGRPEVKKTWWDRVRGKYGRYTGEKVVDLSDVEQFIIDNRW